MEILCKFHEDSMKIISNLSESLLLFKKFYKFSNQRYFHGNFLYFGCISIY